jgi:hypothetical protein
LFPEVIARSHFMKKISPLLLLAAALSWVGPAAAAEKPVAGTLAAAQHTEFSARHLVPGPADVAVFRRGCRPGFTVAPTGFKAYGDWRWPYVSWRGSCDSLYVPGPRVTFVRYQGY